MVLYPKIQRKAQKEIDALTVRDRMPNLDDRPSLPYLECIVKEVYRWHPVLPLGDNVAQSPHSSLIPRLCSRYRTSLHFRRRVPRLAHPRGHGSDPQYLVRDLIRASRH